MLTHLEIKNFRKFDRFTIDFSSRNLLIGTNNAGKTTLIEAIRLVSIVVNRLGSLNFEAAPEWLDRGTPRGVSPSLKGLDFDLGRETFHHYADPPATITATFASGHRVTVYVGAGSEVFATVSDEGGVPYTTKAQARAVALQRIGIQPQVGPLARIERPLNDRYVRGALDSTLAPQHFRNQLRLLDAYFDDFKQAVESTWPGLVVDGIEARGLGDDRQVSLFLRDGGFVGEAASMGHGLQMWLQLIWFLVRSQGDGTVVLDEPDVYMHPDLQRRLLRFVLARGQQVIIATHSVEMMAEVDPEDLLPIDASRRSGKRTSTVKDVQAIVEQLGGVKNLEFARLARADSCLMAPSSDVPLLKRWSDLLARATDQALDTLPTFPCESWSSWPYLLAAKSSIDQTRETPIEARCYMPSALMPTDFLRKRRAEASTFGIDLHVWHRRDLTTYLLRPDVIARLMSSETNEAVEAQQVANQIRIVADGLRVEVSDDYRAAWTAAGGPSLEVEALIESSWLDMSKRLSILSGRRVLLGLSAWSRSTYGIRLGLRDVAREFCRDDLDSEVRSALGDNTAGTLEAGPSAWRWDQEDNSHEAETAPRVEELMDILFG